MPSGISEIFDFGSIDRHDFLPIFVRIDTRLDESLDLDRRERYIHPYTFTELVTPGI